MCVFEGIPGAFPELPGHLFSVLSGSSKKSLHRGIPWNTFPFNDNYPNEKKQTWSYVFTIRGVNLRVLHWYYFAITE